jgi:hypothetical protein
LFSEQNNKGEINMNLNGMASLLALDANLGDGKHLFGSLLGNGSLIAIGVIVGAAIVAAIVIFLLKKKKSNKEDNENK